MSAAADELVGADVARFGVEGWGLRDGVAVLGLGGSGRGVLIRGVVRDFVQVTSEAGSGVDRFFTEFLETTELVVDSIHQRIRLH